jgi:O-antigen/teichoic acid export membrane protein
MPSLPTTARHAINLLGSSVASKFVPLASIFVFSHWMTVAEFGVLSLFTSFIWLFAIAISVNLHTALGRYAYIPAGDLPRFLGTTQIAIGGLLVTGAIALLFIDRTLATWTGLPPVTLPLLLIVVAGHLAESLLTQYAVYKQASAMLLRVVASRAVLTLAVALALLQAMEHDRYLAVIGTEALLSAATVLYTVHAFWGGTRWQFSRPLFAYMLRYSAPLIPYTLSITLLAQLDRMMLDHYFGKEPVGLYSLAFNVGMLFALVMGAVLSAMNPRFFDDMNAKRHGRVICDGRGAFAIAHLLAVGLVSFGPSLTALFVPAPYEPALQLIPAIAVGGLFSVMFQIWGRLMHFAHRTALLSTIASVCVVVKVLVNLVVLPRFGWQAAALSSIIAYGLMAVLTATAVNRRLGLLTLPTRFEMTTCLALGVAAVGFHYVPMPSEVDTTVRLVVMGLLAWPAWSHLAGLRSTAAASRKTKVPAA